MIQSNSWEIAIGKACANGECAQPARKEVPHGSDASRDAHVGCAVLVADSALDEPLGFLMTRWMLLGIKERAEGLRSRRADTLGRGRVA